MEHFKPMRGRKVDLTKLEFPVYVSTKVDGIRCNIIDGKARTKSLKPISNIYTRELLERYPQLEGIEGELTTTWDFSDEEAFNKATGDFRRFEGKPNVCLSIFDVYHDAPFLVRYEYIRRLNLPTFARILPQHLIKDHVQLLAYIEHARESGHEGLMIRSPTAFYKCGMATLAGAQLLKYKFVEDDEAIIVGFEEGNINLNEKKTNELGRSKRSSSKDGLIPSGLVGTILGKHPKWGIVRISGIKDNLAKDMLLHPENYLEQLVTFQYQAHGVMDAPRQAKFKGIRDPNDMPVEE